MADGQWARYLISRCGLMLLGIALLELELASNKLELAKIQPEVITARAPPIVTVA